MVYRPRGAGAWALRETNTTSSQDELAGEDEKSIVSRKGAKLAKEIQSQLHECSPASSLGPAKLHGLSTPAQLWLGLCERKGFGVFPGRLGLGRCSFCFSQSPGPGSAGVDRP